MVTVIADKEELPTPVNNGVTVGSNDNERSFQYIKDYQEVDFHRSSSCRPLPEDLIDGETWKSSVSNTASNIHNKTKFELEIFVKRLVSTVIPRTIHTSRKIVVFLFII
jgi:hypothetical protein